MEHQKETHRLLFEFIALLRVKLRLFSLFYWFIFTLRLHACRSLELLDEKKDERQKNSKFTSNNTLNYNHKICNFFQKVSVKCQPIRRSESICITHAATASIEYSKRRKFHR